MGTLSAGILMYRRRNGGVEVLLVHPGGPFWKRRDIGAWSIPKGEPAPGETNEAAARREFGEELGTDPAGPLIPLGSIRQPGGKTVEAFAVAGDFDVSTFRCASRFEIEWPPRSGRLRSFPEIDQVLWWPLAEAHERILPAQRALLDRLEEFADA